MNSSVTLTLVIDNMSWQRNCTQIFIVRLGIITGLADGWLTHIQMWHVYATVVLSDQATGNNTRVMLTKKCTAVTSCTKVFVKKINHGFVILWL